MIHLAQRGIINQHIEIHVVAVLIGVIGRKERAGVTVAEIKQVAGARPDKLSRRVHDAINRTIGVVQIQFEIPAAEVNEAKVISVRFVRCPEPVVRIRVHRCCVHRIVEGRKVQRFARD